MLQVAQQTTSSDRAIAYINATDRIEKLNYLDIKVDFDEENPLQRSLRDSPKIIASKILKN